LIIAMMTVAPDKIVLRAIQILLGHTKIEGTVRYLGVDIEDALTLAEGTEV
jgi:site-specific recombinase XerD